MLSDSDFAELRAEFNAALPAIIAGSPDRTDLMRSCRRIARGRVTMEEVIGAVSQEACIQVGALTGNRANARTSNARALAILLISDLRPDLSNSQIAQKFNRDPSAIRLAVKRGAELLDTDTDCAHCYQHSRWRLGLA